MVRDRHAATTRCHSSVSGLVSTMPLGGAALLERRVGRRYAFHSADVMAPFQAFLPSTRSNTAST